MRPKIVLFAVFALALVLCCANQTQFVKAQSFSSIDINSDGSVSPSIASIQQVGDIYKLTANINDTSLIVLRNNIVLDGQGFNVQGSEIYGSGQAAINLKCTNVTVTDFHISGWPVGVVGVFDNNVIIGNNFTNNGYDVAIYANNYNVTGNYIASERIVGNNNVISQNVISLGDFATGFWISSSSGTIIEANDVTMTKETTFFISTDNGNFKVYHNNFLNIEVNTGGAFLLIFTYPQHNSIVFPPWDNGYHSGGNYWSDYASRYPNAAEIDNSGIGNTPYVSSTAPEAIDNYPLMTMNNFSKPLILSQPNQNPSQSITTSPSVPEFSSQILGITLVIAMVTVLSAVIVVKKRMIGKIQRG